MTHDKEYLLDNQQPEAGPRLVALSVLFNPTTFRHVRALGLDHGWQLHDALIASGIATEAELARHLATVSTGRLDLATAPMVSAWGRKVTTR